MAVAESTGDQTGRCVSAVEDRPRRESTLPVAHENRNISCRVGDSQIHNAVAKVDRLDGDRFGIDGQRRAGLEIALPSFWSMQSWAVNPSGLVSVKAMSGRLSWLKSPTAMAVTVQPD